MSYSKSLLLYQDTPAYGLLLKLIILVVPVGLLIASIYLWLSGESAGGLVLLVEAFIVGLIFWFVFPRRYQVYEDHVRIVLGGPFSFKVGFAGIEAIRVTSRFTLIVNCATKLTKSCVEITQKRGLPIAITPSDSDLFVENANRALSQWTKISTD